MARKTQREERRRRVLRDEPRPTKKTTKRRKSSSDRVYSERALEKNQPRVTDCLPLRGMSLFFLFVLGVAAIAAVQGLHVARQTYLTNYPQVDTSWMSIGGPMTLSSCLAASYLSLTTIVSLIVFHLRRHKVDDYKGRYRMWYLVIAVLGLASIDSITYAHRGLRDAMLMLVEKSPFQNPAMWWIVGWSVLGGLVGFRAVLEVRRCKLAVFTWLLAIGCFVGAALLYLGRFRIEPAQTHLMARTALFLGGLHLLMFGTALYARFVYLEAQGLKKAKKSSSRKSAKRAAEGEEKRTGLLKLPGLRRGKTATAKKHSAETAEEEDFEDYYEDDYEDVSDEPTEAELELLTNPDLTRSERKKLKRQMKQRRRRAA